MTRKSCPDGSSFLPAQYAITFRYVHMAREAFGIPPQGCQRLCRPATHRKLPCENLAMPLTAESRDELSGRQATWPAAPTDSGHRCWHDEGQADDGFVYWTVNPFASRE